MYSKLTSRNDNNIVFGGVNTLSLKSFNTTTSTSDVSRLEFNILRDKINDLENRNANIQTIIKDVLKEQLQTYITENNIQNLFISTRFEDTKKVQVIEEETVKSAIKTIGESVVKYFERDYPHLSLIRYVNKLLLVNLL